MLKFNDEETGVGEYCQDKQDTPTFVLVFFLHAGQQEVSQSEASLLECGRAEPDFHRATTETKEKTQFTFILLHLFHVVFQLLLQLANSSVLCLSLLQEFLQVKKQT